jgi:hypothetical protein
MRHYLLLLVGVALLVSVGCLKAAGVEIGPAENELKALSAKVPAFRPVALPATGTLTLTPAQSLTIEQLRGVKLDDNPPVLGERPYKPDPRMVDAYPPGEAPYVAKDIAPFRFKYFNLEFNYGGWHNHFMREYASAHGFNILTAYVHKPGDWTHVPAGTKWLKWGGFVDWHKWPQKHGLEADRWDQVKDFDVKGKLLEEKVFAREPGFDYLMIDLEHGLLGLEKLREQAWYPKDAPEAQRQAFEKKYYDGYAQTYLAPLAAARAEGWNNLSLYGWQPFGRRWFGLEKATADRATDFAWNAFGRQIYESVDLLNPTVYCFYWSPQNVAYTLANIDLNRQMITGLKPEKPMRPYFWTLLHGGGGGDRWWAEQPLPVEEARAMMTLALFTGIDGLDQWNWSGTGNHHLPRPLKAGAWVMVGKAFTARPQGAGEEVPPTAFARYDMLKVKSVTEGQVEFLKLDKAKPAAIQAADQPVYSLKTEELTALLRASSEPVAGVVEGLALAKPFEYLLRHGEVKVDVSAQEQYAKTLPVVRRVKLGKLHLLATYDPSAVHGGQPRSIELKDFEGRAGCTVVLPADEQTRLFVLREE